MYRYTFKKSKINLCYLAKLYFLFRFVLTKLCIRSRSRPHGPALQYWAEQNTVLSFLICFTCEPCFSGYVWIKFVYFSYPFWERTKALLILDGSGAVLTCGIIFFFFILNICIPSEKFGLSKTDPPKNGLGSATRWRVKAVPEPGTTRTPTPGSSAARVSVISTPTFCDYYD